MINIMFLRQIRTRHPVQLTHLLYNLSPHVCTKFAPKGVEGYSFLFVLQTAFIGYFNKENTFNANVAHVRS